MVDDPPVPTLRVLPSNIRFDVRPGMTIFEAAAESGVSWPSICNGAVECARCYMEVIEGEEFLSPMGEAERGTLERVRWSGGTHGSERLACCTKINGDVLVRRRSVRVRENFDRRKKYEH